MRAVAGTLPPFTSVAAEIDASNAVEILAVDPHGRVWQTEQSVANNNVFLGLAQLPDTSNTLMAELAVARHSDGRLELVGTDGAGVGVSGSMCSPVWT